MNDSPKWKLWMQEVRAPFFTATAVPIVLGGVIAWVSAGEFHWGYFLLTLVGGLFLHAGTNVANDYWDHRSGADEKNFEFVRPYTGGSRMIQKGLLTPREVITGALLFYLVGSLIGFYLTYSRGMGVIYLGAIGVFSGFFYTAPPFRLVARGVGEFFVGLNFGVLMTVGSYYVQTRVFAWEPVVAGVPVALLIAAVLYINQFQDFKADREAGKKHLVVRLGRERAARGYTAVMWATYISLVGGVVAGVVSPFALLGLLTIPIAIKAVRTARVHYEEYLKLAPANVGTIMTHMLTGLLMTVGYMLDKAI